MSYVLRDKSALGPEVRRVLLEQAGRARALLGDWRANPRDNVHQARQAFKRIRALLRLVRSGARYVYRVENLCFRDLGRQLAYARDSEAVVEALGLLADRVSGPLPRESLRMLRQGLEQRAARERDCGVIDLPGRIGTACASLDDAVRRFVDLPLEDLRRRDLRRGVRRTWEACRMGYERAEASRRPEDLHDWRRHVKSAYHQSRLMEQLMPRWSAAVGPGLAQLGEALGHHQDLSVLDRLLRTQADALNIDVHLQAIRRALREAEADLAAESLQLGHQAFAPAAADAEHLIDLNSAN